MEENAPQSWFSRLRSGRNEEYQLMIRDVKSFREVGSFNLTPLNLYVALSTIIVLVAVVVFCLVAYTPLRKYIPGYGDIVQRQEMNQMEDQLVEMEKQLRDQSLYIDNLRRTINGEATTDEDIPEQATLIDSSDVQPVPLSEAEVQLRREMDLERVGANSRRGPSAAPLPGSDDVPLAEIALLHPVSGEISARFKATADHLGVDILAPQNTPIKAARAGVVFMSEFTNDNGNVIGIQHDHNLVSFYKHNSRLLKQVGDRVRPGEAIAIIGNTGKLTTGPHLHFELWHEGQPVDPADYLSF